MTITGPILPKRFFPYTNNAPTPGSNLVTSTVPGEIVICTKTGRMWVNHNDAAMIPVRPEFAQTSIIYGETKAGIRGYTTGTAPLNAQGVEIYGSLIRLVNEAGVGCPVQIPGDLTVSSGFVNTSSSSFTVSTNQAVNPGSSPVELKALKVQIGNAPHASGAAAHLLAVTSSVGSEFGDLGGPAGAYRLNALISDTKAQFERVIEANDNIQITDLPNSYRLGTGANGLVVNANTITNDVDTGLAADVVLVANTDTELTALQTTVGSAGITSVWRLTLTVQTLHNGNHDVSFKLRNHTASVDLSGLTYSSSGYGNGTCEAIISITGTAQIRAQVQSTHTPTVRQYNLMNGPATKLLAQRLA